MTLFTKSPQELRREQERALATKLGSYGTTLTAAIDADGAVTPDARWLDRNGVTADDREGWLYVTSFVLDGDTMAFRMDRHFQLTGNLITVGECIALEHGEPNDDHPGNGVYAIAWNKDSGEFFLLDVRPGEKLRSILAK